MSIFHKEPKVMTKKEYDAKLEATKEGDVSDFLGRLHEEEFTLAEENDKMLVANTLISDMQKLTKSSLVNEKNLLKSALNIIINLKKISSRIKQIRPQLYDYEKKLSNPKVLKESMDLYEKGLKIYTDLLALELHKVLPGIQNEKTRFDADTSAMKPEIREKLLGIYTDLLDLELNTIIPGIENEKAWFESDITALKTQGRVFRQF